MPFFIIFSEGLSKGKAGLSGGGGLGLTKLKSWSTSSELSSITIAAGLEVAACDEAVMES